MCAKEKTACVSSLHGNTKELQSMSTLDPVQQMTVGYYKLFNLSEQLCMCAYMADVGCYISVSKMEEHLIRYKILNRAQLFLFKDTNASTEA